MSSANPAKWKIDKPKSKWSDSRIEPILWGIPQMMLNMQLQVMPTCIPNYQSLDMPRGTDITDSTQKYAIKRATGDTFKVFGVDVLTCIDDPNLIVCKNVEAIFNMLQEDLQDVCELYYFQKIRPVDIIEILGISSKTLYAKLPEMRQYFATLA